MKVENTFMTKFKIIIVQVCNQEFAMAWEFSWNYGNLINLSSTTQEIKALQGKMLDFSP